MSLRKLTEILNSPNSLGDATISEGDGLCVNISGLSAETCSALRDELDSLRWSYELEDNYERVPQESEKLKVENQPYMLSLNKPPSERKRFLTLFGFINWLEAHPEAEIVEVAGCEVAFSTDAFLVTGWGGVDEGEVGASPRLRNPRDIVRDHGSGLVPEDLRPFLLRRGSSFEWGDKAFQAWAKSSARHLCSSLASIIFADGKMKFGGPPIIEVGECKDSDFSKLTSAGFKALQESARWVFENPLEAETKHVFLSIEIARSPSSRAGMSPYVLFAEVLAHALESAMLANKLNISRISGDTLRALNDLRKSLADEASKASDVARQVYSGTAAAVFASIGVSIARIAGDVPSFAVRSLAVVVGVYLLGLAGSAIFQILSQKEIRAAWRPHLYRFLSEADYKSMVSDPARLASMPLMVSIVLAFIAALGLFALLWVLPDLTAAKSV